MSSWRDFYPRPVDPDLMEGSLDAMGPGDHAEAIEPLPTCPACGSDSHSPNVCAYRPSAREIALEAALHQIASETYNRQYDTKPCATKVELHYAARWHDIARAAIDPPEGGK